MLRQVLDLLSRGLTMRKTIVSCPNQKCGQWLRLPLDLGLLDARCPTCGQQFRYTPFEEPAPHATPRPDTHQTARSGMNSRAFAQLNRMIGLTTAKQQIAELAQFAHIQAQRKRHGLALADVSKHLVFTGNPGTGKTTVARLIGEIYFEAGLTRSAKVVEVGRPDLVGEYIGHTAIKTTEKIEEALGGILFIDEAYTLVGDGKDFGKEAIDTLLKDMENHRDDLTVIVAGYPADMAAFVGMNPGLKSRFANFIHFDDYTPAELATIFESQAQKADYAIDPAGKTVLLGHFTRLTAASTHGFGNGREARNLYEKSIRAQASRLYGQTAPTAAELRTLIATDIRRAAHADAHAA
jgi:replication-associated recombination protein RarA